MGREQKAGSCQGVRGASRPEASSASRKTKSFVPAWLQSGPLATWPQVLSVFPHWIICSADASFLVTLEMKTVEGDSERV